MTDMLQPGESLGPNQSLWSSSGRFSLDYQDNGDLALHKYFRDGNRRCLKVLTGGKGKVPGRCTMQEDGNLVVYSDAGQVVWASGTWRDEDGSRLVLQDDGNAVIYRPSGGAVWASNTVSPTPAAGHPPNGNTMNAGAVLPAGQTVTSANGSYCLEYQLDGNLVLYRNNANGRNYMWDNGMHGRPADSLIMQNDGNLVAYGPDNQVVWSTDTWRDEDGSWLVVQDDGNVVLYRPSGGAIWSTDTPRITLRQELRTELHGAVEITIRPSGEVKFTGIVRNHRIESISYRIRLVVRSAGQDGKLTALAFERAGHVDGDLDPTWDPRDTWEKSTQNPVVGTRYRSLEHAYPQLEVFEAVEGGITGPLVGFLGDAVKFALGSTPLGTAAAVVIFVGVELGSLLFSDSLVPGARIISGYLWLAGPYGTLFALAAEGIAALGTETREMRSEEHAFLTETLFGNTLPPREQIIFTDSYGLEDSLFVFPRFDGKITVNVGPTNFASEQFYRSEYCVHEITHVWQLHNDSNRIAWLADALITQICDQFTDAYDPGSELKPWADYNLEQQARIVQVWYQDTKGNRDLAHRYDQYIDGQLRLGKTYHSLNRELS